MEATLEAKKTKNKKKPHNILDSFPQKAAVREVG